MFKALKVINLAPQAHISLSDCGNVFVLKTCQRTLLLGFGQSPFYLIEDSTHIRDVFTANDAYTFLLETICGLKSEVIAEYEIVNQFKTAYQEFMQLEKKNSHIIFILEKLFKDSKKIRTDYLTEIGQLSYAGIARKLIHTKQCQSDVLIVGSGSLAVDLIKLLKKKHRVFITARNTQKAAELAMEHSLQILDWKDYQSYQSFNVIVNTIGSDEILFNEIFFSLWIQPHSSSLPSGITSKLFIDLGSPSVIDTHCCEQDGVYRLEDIFKQSARLNSEKMEKVTRARDAINLVAHNRLQHAISYPMSWEELQFA